MTPSGRSGVERPLLVILLVTTLALVALDRPLARGDGIAYFMWLDSIAGDGDMDLTNQAEAFAHVNTYQVYWEEDTGRWASVFPYGPGLMLVPGYWLARLADSLGWLRVNDEYFIGLQGRPLPYSLLPMFMVNLYALGAVALAYLCARFFVSPVPAAVAALALFLGMPTLYYATVEPFMAHVISTFLVALGFYLLLSWRKGERSLWLVIGAGAAGGLATLVRWQVSLVVVALALWLPLRRQWKAAGLFALGYWAVAWHALYTWNWMFGRPLVAWAAESGFLSAPSRLPQVLFSDARGLFVWSPLAFLGLIGLGLLARRSWRWALSLFVAFLLQALINAGVVDWWGGWSFGLRRMTELYPLFVVGLACLLGGARPRWLRVGLYGLAVVLLLFTLLLLLSHLNYINTAQAQGDRASSEIQYQLTQSSFDVTWEVIRQHYGPWAWSRPGP